MTLTLGFVVFALDGLLSFLLSSLVLDFDGSSTSRNNTLETI